jgi:hypothetical protein
MFILFYDTKSSLLNDAVTNGLEWEIKESNSILCPRSKIYLILVYSISSLLFIGADLQGIP